MQIDRLPLARSSANFHAQAFGAVGPLATIPDVIMIARSSAEPDGLDHTVSIICDRQGLGSKPPLAFIRSQD